MSIVIDYNIKKQLEFPVGNIRYIEAKLLDVQWLLLRRGTDTSAPRHFGTGVPETLRHRCRTVRETFRHRCRSVRDTDLNVRLTFVIGSYN